MSTYGTPSAGSRILRANAPRTRLTGITETLNTPGLAVPPPMSAGANTAAQLLSLMEQVGGAANAANAYVRQGQADERRRQAELEEADRKRKQAEQEAATVMRGKAEMDSTAIAVKYGALIQSGKVALPGDFNAYVNQIVQDEAGGETNPDYINQLRKSVGGKLAGEVQQQQVQQARAADAQIEAAHSAAAFANPADVQAVIADRKRLYPNQTEAQQLSPILAAAQRKAEIGSEDYKTLAASLPDSIFGIAKDELLAQYTVAKSRQASQSDAQAANTIGLLLTGTDGTDPDITGARTELSRLRSEGRVSGNTLENLANSINAKEAAFRRESSARVTEEQKRAIVSNHIASAMSLIPSGNLSKATALKQDIKDENGNIVSTVTLEESKVKELALQAQLAANDGYVGGAYGLVPDNFNPTLSERNIATASYTGMLPEQWKRDMKSGMDSASAAILTNPDAPIPQSLVDGAQTFLRLKNTNLVAQLDDRTRVYYEAFNDLRNIPAYANDQASGERRALADALRAANGPGRKLTDQETKALNQALESAAIGIEDPFGPGEASNGKAEMRSEMQRYANLFLSMGYPGSVSTLVEKAQKIVQEKSIIINDAVVIDPGGLSPNSRENISKIGESVIDDYMEKVGTGSGYNREELRFYTSGIGGTALWELRDQLGHSIPTKPGVQTRFTTRELVEKWNSPEAIEKSAERRRKREEEQRRARLGTTEYVRGTRAPQ